MEKDFDFELPAVVDTAPVKPRVHMAVGESVCISCEG